MPYTKESLEKYNVLQLKNIFNIISAHKAALMKPPYNNKKHAEDRETEIRKQGQKKVFLLGSEYKKKVKIADKKAYLIPKILAIQEAPFLPGSRYENNFKDASPDYSNDFGDIHIQKKSTIDPQSGYIKQGKVEVVKSESEEEEEGAAAAAKEPEKQPEPVDVLESEIQKYKEKQPQGDGSQTSLSRAPKEKKFDISKFKSSRSERFKDDLNQFDELMVTLSELGPTGKYKAVGEEAKGLSKEIYQSLLSSVKGMSKSVNKKDSSEYDTYTDRLRSLSSIIKKSMSESGVVDVAKEGLAALGNIGKRVGEESLEKLEQNIEELQHKYKNPPPSFESEEKTRFVQNTMEAPFKTLSGDQDIGNVRAIGIVAPMQALAKEDDVIPPASERAKSLRRFVNFRWVYSTQNSSIGYDSPFQKIQEQEDKRQFSNCYLPTNKLPKEETQEDLDKAKSFNTYPLVPQQSLVGMMQPASELSFKTSTNPHARKITIDEKQFANTKLYNFEPTQVNIKPTNPFSSMYGMEAIDQIKRNPNLQTNTLEFSSVMYDDCPLERIKRKYMKIVT